MKPGDFYKRFLESEAGLIAQDLARNTRGLMQAGATIGTGMAADVVGGVNASLAALGGDQDPSWYVDQARDTFTYIPRSPEGMEYLQSAAGALETAGEYAGRIPGAGAAREGWEWAQTNAPMASAVGLGIVNTFGPGDELGTVNRASKRAVDAVDRVNQLQNRMPAPQDVLDQPGVRENTRRISQENQQLLAAEEAKRVEAEQAIKTVEDIRRRANAPPERVALEQEFLGRDDDFWDIKSDENGSEFRKSGYSGVTCTGYACEIKEKLGKDRVQVYGFDTKDNPAPRLEGHPGHDFAIVDGRYIVDPWISDVEMTGRGVLDLHDPADAAEIRDVYGDPAKWGALGEKPLDGMAGEVRYDGRLVKQAPHAPAQIAAAAYRSRTGIGSEAPRKYVKADPERGSQIAKAYEEMPHAPDDPEVQASYNALIDETLDQWREIEKTGLKVEFIPPGAPDPYPAGPRGAIEDVRNNNHLWVYPTDAGYGEVGADLGAMNHPLLRPTGVEVGGKQLLANDVFRIVHDYFGHIKEGNGFRADGEENAWMQHAAMYSEKARGAMTSETRGQNSWLNFGPHGAKNRTAKTEDTVFAEQKAGLLPKEYWSDEALGLKPKAEQKAADTTINIGLNIGDKVGALKPARVQKELKKLGIDLLDSSVVISPTGEPTITGRLSRALTKEEGDLLSRKLDQEAVSQRQGDAGDLLGPKAAEWGPFNKDLFAEPPEYDRKIPEKLKRKLDKNPELRPLYERVLPYLTDEEIDRLRPQGAAALQKLLGDADAGTVASADDIAMMASLGRAKRGWYEHSAQALVDVFGAEDAPRFSALLAALSPQTSVEDNLKNALRVWKGWTAASRPTDRQSIMRIMGENVQGDKGEKSVMDAWRNNSITALSHADPRNARLSGPKVNSFAANLRGVVNEVTNDTWMAEALGVTQSLFSGANLKGLDPKGFGGKGIGYLFSNALTRQAADILTQATGVKWTPAEVQETVWSWVKTVVEKRRSKGVDDDILTLAGQVTDDEIAGTADFATLLRDGEYSDILKEAGYADQLNLLAQQPPKASPAYAAREGGLERVASRLERQYQAGKESAVRGGKKKKGRGAQKGSASTDLLRLLAGGGLVAGAYSYGNQYLEEQRARQRKRQRDLLRMEEQ